MKRSQPIIVPLTDDSRNIRIILEADPSTTGTVEDRKAVFGMLQAIVDDPMLSNCMGKDFEKMLVYYDGSKWIADCSAVVRGKWR